MPKVVISKGRCHFDLSQAAVERYAQLKGLSLYPDEDHYGHTRYWLSPPEQRPPELAHPWCANPLHAQEAYNKACSEVMLHDRDIPRDDPHLVQVVEELGDAAGELKIVHVPDDVEWGIHHQDYCEWVAERHRIWA